MSVTATSHAGASWCAFTAANRPGWSSRLMARLCEGHALGPLTERLGFLRAAKLRCDAYDAYERGFRRDFVDRVLLQRAPSARPDDLAVLVDLMAPRRCRVTPQLLERIVSCVAPTPVAQTPRSPPQARERRIEPAPAFPLPAASIQDPPAPSSPLPVQVEAWLWECHTCANADDLAQIEDEDPEQIKRDVPIDPVADAFWVAHATLAALPSDRLGELTQADVAEQFRKSLAEARRLQPVRLPASR